jgi:ubiquitin-conjugating enzyme E2 J2
MSSSAAIRRLRKEYQLLQATPEFGLVAAPLETNVLEWHFVLFGSSETPYQGGIYHGKLVFPTNFPMKPPSIMMITESGRFAVNRKICMSMSDFHPELWNPMWGVRSILIAMLSFMNGEELTTGGMTATDGQRVECARRSLIAITNDDVVKELFPDIINQADANLVYIDNWPPPPLEPPGVKSLSDSEATSDDKKPPPAAEEETEEKKDDDIEEDAVAVAARKARTAKSNARKRAKAKTLKQGIALPATGSASAAICGEPARDI